MSYRRVSIAFLIAIASLWAQTKPANPRGHAERIAPQPPSFDPNVIGSTNQPEFHPKDKGSGVARAEILLDRVHFSCGQIDGYFGSNLEKTVAAYQGDRHLPVTRIIDSQTWAALNADKAPLLVRYTISPDDEAGPFVKVPREMMAQAKLKFLGYASPLEELSERFHASPELMQGINPGVDFSQAGQEIWVPNVLTMPPGQAAQVVVSKGESSVRAYDANGKLLAFYVATIGSEHDPLPVGNWKITGIQHNPYFHYNAELFWDARNKDEKALIKPGPRNPVGLVWMDLSKEHYGIHGTPDPSKIGHTFSHGCIRLTNWDALELAAMVQPGTPAILKE